MTLGHPRGARRRGSASSIYCRLLLSSWDCFPGIVFVDWLPAVTALSTWCRSTSETPDGFAARAAALGASAVAIEATVNEDFLEPLVPALLVRALAIVAVEAPLAGTGPGTNPRARSPWLATADREERRAAVIAAGKTLARASDIGTKVVVVRLGTLPLRHDEAGLARRFHRGAADREAIERLVAERSQLSRHAMDLARFGLEPVLARADAAGVTVAIANRPRWVDIPEDMEIAALLEDFHGAPLAPWFDTAAAHARATLGLGAAVPSWVDRAAGAWLSDACGLRGGLPWGRGEVDAAAVAAALPTAALRVVHCAPAAQPSDAELAAALA
jgi:hypothetical protein